jgi:two-component system NtrC family sensor kinase
VEQGEEQGVLAEIRKTRLENRRILVIDDNRVIHEDFRKILVPTTAASDELEQAGASLFDEEPVAVHGESFDVSFADQGEQGFRMVEQAVAAGKPYAVAFVDMRMPPGWDGVETIDHIWKVDPEIQVVICTAFSDHPWHRIAARLGNPDRLLILRKPFDAVEVEQLAVSLACKWELGRRAILQIDYLNGLVELRHRELQDANGRLEKEVATRTAELSTRNAQLQQLNEQLQDFVNQLRGAVNPSNRAKSA